ncbi:hypothetical protein F8388_013670 [Cannabis sativa]|uniref:DUF4283 domain-containing protein n=1 Tax=Cannabis sativa TaxID=3483 RepID=A0A7J6EJU8_CANSA|nr:hypothetical protein G4B88_015073 [Cannabis sativa]KAF4358866.1 hypothetical protein F8388_013670 [Cannabis sativa]
MDPTKVCDLFEDSVQISQDDLTFALNPGEVDEPQEANQVLLGKIISRHKFGKAAIQGSLKLSWNAIKGWKWKDIGNGILQFTFARREDALNVLARRPWFICGALIIESIPPFYWNLSNLKELASKASPVYELPPMEKSTFTSPLAKWFQDWCLQKRLCHDPILRNQMKVHKAIRNGEEAEIRECRRQYPGKKRIVTDEDENTGDSNSELVITQLPLVYLPGIGEIAPFGNNSKSVSVQDLQEAAEQFAAAKTKRLLAGEGDQRSASTPVPEPVTGTNGAPSVLVETNLCDMESRKIDIPFGKPSVITTKEGSDQGSFNKNNILGQELLDSTNKNSDLILGSQAHCVDWPSNECWAQPKARELLMGALTVDKYHREPTLFNPIIDIEDFRVQEHLYGPRKRKATDGLIFRPNTKGNSSPDSSNPVKQWAGKETNYPSSSTTTVEVDSKESFDSPASLTEVPTVTNYSPGSQGESKQPTPRRGRKPKNFGSLVEEGVRKRRGRPPKSQSPLAATPKTFKRGKNTNSKLGGNASTSNHWDDRNFDLKDSSKYLIIGEISSDPPGIPWKLLGTYGPPTRVDKEQFWVQMGDIVMKSQFPLLLLGDMNGTLNDRECFNYNGNASQYAFDFRRMVHRAGLIDLGFIGPNFTWGKGGGSSNGRGPMKRARLDRGLVSIDWRILFPDAIINHLTATASDHRPLMLDTTGGVKCKGRQFKYENMWERDPRSFWVESEGYGPKAWELEQESIHSSDPTNPECEVQPAAYRTTESGQLL